ncbi:MAG: ferredoxin family protein [Burkholderiales bacterium]|jgi:ferredoxin like protein|nr:ferredoxin family protein [Burkholderiales bacterium]
MNTERTKGFADKLAVNLYNVDVKLPHIVLDNGRDRETLAKIEAACPARLYRTQPDGSVRFDYFGCLECGTCRVLDDTDVFSHWSFPKGGYGVLYRFG